MLERRLEPELMDTTRDAIEYDAMDFTEANTKFAVDALALLDRRPNPEVLDIGTGTAQIPILMLDRNPRLQILAVDLAGEMIRLGIEKVKKAGYAAQCRLEKQDAKALRVPSHKYDLVLCNSTAHHIPNPVDLFREIARVVKPDGAIIIRDLIRPLSEDDAWAIVKRVAAGEHVRQQQLFFDSLCAALSLAEVEQMLAAAGLRGLRVGRVSDRHWTAERRAGPPAHGT
jgi:ubiquinone/menaquinone biosynthesis C-methylase UbiE